MSKTSSVWCRETSLSVFHPELLRDVCAESETCRTWTSPVLDTSPAGQGTVPLDVQVRLDSRKNEMIKLQKTPSHLVFVSEDRSVSDDVTVSPGS